MSERNRLADVVDGLSARDAERLRELLDQRLKVCAIDGFDGADLYLVRKSGRAGDRERASILLCPACFERHRLPESRAEAAPR